MGRKTYDQMLGFGDWPHGDKRVIVLTSSPLGAGAPPGVEVWPGDMDRLTGGLAGAGGKDVWLVGGAQVSSSITDSSTVSRFASFRLCSAPVCGCLPAAIEA